MPTITPATPLPAVEPVRDDALEECDWIPVEDPELSVFSDDEFPEDTVPATQPVAQTVTEKNTFADDEKPAQASDELAKERERVERMALMPDLQRMAQHEMGMFAGANNKQRDLRTKETLLQDDHQYKPRK